MASTPPIVANTDFQQWHTWKPVKDPNSDRTYYVIPGYGDRYVFDPYASNASGRIELYENPEPYYLIAEQERKAQEAEGSISNQLAGLAGGIAGTAGTAAIANAIAGGGAAAPTVAAPVAAGTVGGTAAASGAGLAGGSAVGGGAGGGAAAGSALGGALPAAGVAGAAALYGANLYNYGGKDIISGKGDKKDWSNVMMQANPMTAWMNPLADVLGFGNVGNLLFKPSTKDRQKERAAKLAKKDQSFAQVQAISNQNAADIARVQQLAAEQTGEGFKGWHTVEGVGPVWVNKLAPQGEKVKHNAEYFSMLGSGDVLHMPWLYENVEGYGQKPLEEKIKIADAALQFGQPRGNAGNIDFKLTPEFKAVLEGKAPEDNDAQQLANLLDNNVRQGASPSASWNDILK